jgi:hypothetical protein
VGEARDRQAEKEQCRKDQREERELEMQQAAEAAFAKLPAEEQAAFRERTEREFLSKYPRARAWKAWDQQREAGRRQTWLHQWNRDHPEENSIGDELPPAKGNA